MVADDLNGFDNCVFVRCFFIFISTSVVRFPGLIHKNISYCFIRVPLVSLLRTFESKASGSFEISWFKC